MQGVLCYVCMFGYVAMHIWMCYMYVRGVCASTAAEARTRNLGLDPVAFIPSELRRDHSVHRGGIHWRANDGLSIAKRCEAVGAVRLALALPRRLDGQLSKLAQFERTRARDILEPFTVTLRLPEPTAGPRWGVITSIAFAVKTEVFDVPHG